jgi:hypothetical protein
VRWREQRKGEEKGLGRLFAWDRGLELGRFGLGKQERKEKGELGRCIAGRAEREKRSFSFSFF